MTTKSPPLYRPVFFRNWRDVTKESLLADLASGLTVGVIALPLAIGFGIASGATPGQGLWTAIIGGLVISIFGGSRYQIGGPTGAFVPVLASVMAVHGYQGLALATLMAGVLLVCMGLFKLGGVIRYIPYPVVAGFTSGIAVIIFLGQMPDFLGQSFKRPGDAPELSREIIAHLSQAAWQPATVGALTLLILFLWPRVTRRVPAAIIAIIAATVLTRLMDWPVATVGSKFGDLPSGLPGWHFPDISLEAMRALMSSAFTIAALGGIESLLSATVADGMTDTKHDSNSELIGQGLANIITPLVGGFAATGAIARTAANIRSGARSPVSGLVHTLVLLLFVLAASSLVRHIPLAALAAVLMAVALRMAEWDTFKELWHSSRPDFVVCVTAFTLTVVFDLTVGVGIGLAIAAVLFVKRMEDVAHVRLLTPESDTERDGENSLRGRTVPEGVVLFRFEGPLFFAAVEKLEAALRHYMGKPCIVVFRMRHVPVIDASALHSLQVAVEKMKRDGVQVLFTAIQPQPMKVLYKSGLAGQVGLANFCANIEEALDRCQKLLEASRPPGEASPDGTPS